MQSRTKSLIDRAKQTSAQSYLARFRAQSIAGLAHSLCRESALLRRQGREARSVVHLLRVG